jgi:hypothetical protein
MWTRSGKSAGLRLPASTTVEINKQDANPLKQRNKMRRMIVPPEIGRWPVVKRDIGHLIEAECQPSQG